MAEVIQFPVPFPAPPRFGQSMPPEFVEILAGESMVASIEGRDCTNGGVTSGHTAALVYATHEAAEADESFREGCGLPAPAALVLEFFHGNIIAIPALQRGQPRPWTSFGGHTLRFDHPLMQQFEVRVHDRIE